jgi:WD40 repeat protein
VVSADPSDRQKGAADDQGGGGYRVDARGAAGVQVGEGNTQIIYTYTEKTFTDGVAPPPLVGVSGVVESPYRGLGAFEERDAVFFFGRDNAITRVLAELDRQARGGGVLVVSGVSGAGKSSLLRAGVLPRIRGQGLASAPDAASWPCLVFTPGRAPLDELAVRVAALAGSDAGVLRQTLATDVDAWVLTARQAALAHAGPTDPRSGEGREPRLLLVVDQFEQVFTQCSDEQERQAFITALHAAATSSSGSGGAPAALVVLVVRADFEARCADFPQLAAAVQDRFLVTAMTQRQLRMVITEPAKAAGSRVDDDLVRVLLDDVGALAAGPVAGPGADGGMVSRAGVLPLLSHVLDQAWRGRAGDTVTVADYERAGGIERAVAGSAQRAFNRLTPAQQAAARLVFLRLTATSPDGVDAADRATRAELLDGKDPAAAADVEAVLESFAAERLLVLAAGSVELSHEVLLRAWPLLRDTWLADTHTDRVVLTRLRAAAAEWTSTGHDPSYLYTGSLLETATSAATRSDTGRHLPVSPAEHTFLQASTRARRRSANRRRGFTTFLIITVIALAAATLAAVYANQNATNASQNAIRQRDIAISNDLINRSETVDTTNPTAAKIESLIAWRLNPGDQSRYALPAAAALPGIATLTGHTATVKSVVFSPDGRFLASGSVDASVRLWDGATRRQIGGSLTGHADVVTSVAFSPDGRTLASGGADHSVGMWDVATRQQIGEPLTGHTSSVNSVVFSPDGRTLASGGEDKTVRLWDVATRRQIGGPLTGHTSEVTSVAFSPDGRTLASGSDDETVRLWDVSDLPDEFGRLCRQIGGSVTPEQWNTYVPRGGSFYEKVCP